VGRVGRAHGIRGDVAIDVRTDEPDRRFAVGTSFATARGQLTIESARWHGVRLLVRFEQVADRTAAEAIRGAELRLDVAPDQRPDDPEEFYDHQLVGLTARLESGEVLGPVTDVLHLPAQDVLVLDYDGREILVPFIADFVPTVDLPGRSVVLRPAPGLLDLEEG
jgi:16S rRNA processing protein RimM